MSIQGHVLVAAAKKILNTQKYTVGVSDRVFISTVGKGYIAREIPQGASRAMYIELFCWIYKIIHKIDVSPR